MQIRLVQHTCGLGAQTKDMQLKGAQTGCNKLQLHSAGLLLLLQLLELLQLTLQLLLLHCCTNNWHVSHS